MKIKNIDVSNMSTEEAEKVIQKVTGLVPSPWWKLWRLFE
jgi:hypothetical protein